MVDVNEDLTRHVAYLARLDLDEAEVKAFTQQLNKILHYIEKLQEVDVTGVQPIVCPIQFPKEATHPEVGCLAREDLCEPWPLTEDGKPKVLASAPDVLYDGFKVPPIL